ncbi:MAG TPA: tetratricopeptide repeat protein [Blastocatellia bacterium]|nr:tetratricopeptide repeat protein [Blastocatellia bacterium]
MRAASLKLTLFALLVSIHLFLGAGSVSAQSRDRSDPISGRVALIEPKGGLKIRQSKRAGLMNATEGMLVRRGYLLILDPVAKATIVCGDGKKRELAPGPQGCPCTLPCTPAICGIRYEGSTIRATRGPDTNDSAFPVVISPRRTLAGNLRPAIRWAPVAGAKADTTYNVTLYGEGMRVVWARDVISETRLAYPETEPPLAAGQTYKVVVTTNGLSSQQDRSPGLGFITLTADQASLLAAEEIKARQLGLPETQTRFLIANLYAARELYSEAIEQLENCDPARKNPAAISLIGDLYAEIGLNREAEKKYLQALALTPANDLDGLGSNHRNLATVYENLGEFDHAIAQLKEAITVYRRLRNLRVASVLLNDERRLKNPRSRE